MPAASVKAGLVAQRAMPPGNGPSGVAWAGRFAAHPAWIRAAVGPTAKIATPWMTPPIRAWARQIPPQPSIGLTMTPDFTILALAPTTQQGQQQPACTAGRAAAAIAEVDLEPIDAAQPGIGRHGRRLRVGDRGRRNWLHLGHGWWAGEITQVQRQVDVADCFNRR